MPTSAPEEDAPIGRSIEIVVLAAEEDMVTLTTATTPSEIEVEFIPLTKHLYEPLPPLQLTDFPAAVAADPVETATAETFEAGYVNVH